MLPHLLSCSTLNIADDRYMLGVAYGYRLSDGRGSSARRLRASRDNVRTVQD